MSATGSLYTDPDEQEQDMEAPFLFDASDFADAIQGLLDGDFDTEQAFPNADLRSVTFKDAGLLTSNDGLVVTLSDGSEFQVTVVRSR